MPYACQLWSSSSWDSARCTTRARRNSHAACRYALLSIRRQRCSGASRRSLTCADRDCNACRCLSAANLSRHEALDVVHDIPSLVVAGLGARTESIAATVSRISSNASKTCFEDFANWRIDVEACNRSRYRSLRFHDASEQLDANMPEIATHPTINRSSSCLASASILNICWPRPPQHVITSNVPQPLLHLSDLRYRVLRERFIRVNLAEVRLSI